MIVSHITINNDNFDIFSMIIFDIIIENDGRYLNNDILTTIIINDDMNNAFVTLTLKRFFKTLLLTYLLAFSMMAICQKPLLLMVM